MEQKKVSGYQKLVFLAYGFFMLLGIVWFFMSFSPSLGHFNASAFFIVAVFGAQVYYRHRFTNLILGILGLLFSIFMLLDVISTFDLMAKKAIYDGLTISLLVLSLMSIAMSGILIFSYTRLKADDEYSK